MKKILCALLALTSIFCLAACENGKCDECGAKNDTVKVYEDEGEFCATCALEKLGDKFNDWWNGDK